MKNIRVYDKFQIELDRKSVLRLMDCYEDSPVYEEAAETYEELKNIMMKIIEPKAILCIGSIPCAYEVEDVLATFTPVIYSIVTIGRKASSLSNQFFSEGEYLKGMLADVIADSCVFAIESELKVYVKDLCIEKEIGISHRYEAPTDIPMKYQLLVYEQCKAEELLDMKITTGYMLDPLKSNCHIYVITKDKLQFKVEHDCRNCDNLKCKLRHIPDTDMYIYDKSGNAKGKMNCQYGESILMAYIRQGGYMSAPCAGQGTCGKCSIRVRAGNLPITNEDEAHFTKKELELGYRLSCQAYPQEDCEIELQDNMEEEFQILGSFVDDAKENHDIDENLEYSFAIDIGTTTLAISLVEKVSNRILDTYTSINHQNVYGSDVISRIQASNDGKTEELQSIIQKDLLCGFNKLIEDHKVDLEHIKYITIVGNTTMIHLLLGFSCKSLGVAPFTPIDIHLMERTFREVFLKAEMNKDFNWYEKLAFTKVIFLPGISTFVGADIVSGIYAKEMYKSEKYNILVDLGTNGEMAVGNREKIFVASAAMGPACEGGNITHGMGGVVGAIDKVSIDLEENVTFSTIGEGSPIGICGTGVLETVAELVKNNLIDETGLLDDRFFEEGFLLAKTKEDKEIVFTQKDVREIQLAKAAVRAGVETLLKRAGIACEQIDKLYLAGGFGFYLDRAKAVAIGLFPKELLGKIEVVGNTALEGGISYQEKDKEILLEIVNNAEELPLSVDRYFNECYVEYMTFDF